MADPAGIIFSLMQAAVLEHYGSPHNFRIKDVGKPAIATGQVLVRSYASSVNPIDVLVREGTLRLLSGLLGEPIIGTDYCGTVVESRSTQFEIGDELFGCVAPTTGHAYAQLVVVNETETALKPPTLSYTEAAALALVSLTAYQALVHEGRLRAGQRVLINGCTGGVGSAAVQIARILGARVTGTCQAEHLAAARALGCDEVLDYHTQPLMGVGLHYGEMPGTDTARCRSGKGSRADGQQKKRLPKQIT